MTRDLPAPLGLVVIGRNEGARLERCLRSASGVRHKVYVDSGSCDGSVDLAAGMGWSVVRLTSPPSFTAARARNEGVRHLLQSADGLKFVQMVDGDCELGADWLQSGLCAFDEHEDAGAVFGRTREQCPRKNLYHMMCNDEWDVPLGEVGASGGNVMLRLEALQQAGGYDPGMIAGEEPDLCLRMRQSGWKVLSLDAEMTVHDVAMDRFSQWWRRAERGGHACAALLRAHPRSRPGWRRPFLSIVFWNLLYAMILGLGVLAFFTREPRLATLALILFAAVAAQTARLAVRKYRAGWTPIDSLGWAVMTMITKVPQLQGVGRFIARGATGKRAQLIEYKS